MRCKLASLPTSLAADMCLIDSGHATAPPPVLRSRTLPPRLSRPKSSQGPSNAPYRWVPSVFVLLIVFATASVGLSTVHIATGLLADVHGEWARGRGLQEAAAAPPPIRRIAVVGERHSGTNLVEKLLKLNLDTERVTVGGGFTAHKHWMQPDPKSAIQAEGVLLVLPVRNAYDWATTLHRTCYCCEVMESLDFRNFVSGLYQPTADMADVNGVACTTDVNTERGNATFENVISMRAAKIENVLGLAQRWNIPLESVKLEDLWYPELQVTWVEGLVAKYNLPLKAAPAPSPSRGKRDRLAAAQQGCSRSNDAQQGESSSSGVRLRGCEKHGGRVPSVGGALPAPTWQLRLRRLSSLLSNRRGGSGSGAEELPQVPETPVWQIKAVGEEVRGWVEAPFTIQERVEFSYYHNPQLLRDAYSNGQEVVESVTPLLDLALEAALGYHRIVFDFYGALSAGDNVAAPEPPPPPSEEQLEAERRQAAVLREGGTKAVLAQQQQQQQQQEMDSAASEQQGAVLELGSAGWQQQGEQQAEHG